MKKNLLTLITAGVLGIVFILLLFTFQVRQTEVAVVTTFGRYSSSITKPGWNFRGPWPIQKIYKFENRIQNFERKFEQTTTKDAKSILITVFIGWRIEKPEEYLIRFNGDPMRAESALEGLVRDTKNGVIGQHPFSDLISPEPKDLKFDQIEKEMLLAIKNKARDTYGIEVTLLGIKQLGLPEAITTKVFDRMKEERQRLVKQLVAEGESRAKEIRADAEKQRQELLTKAEAQAIVIKGEGDAQAANSYAVMEKNPDLAIFLLQLDALEKSLKDRTSLILDQQTPPFNMLNSKSVEFPGKSAPAAARNQK